MTFQEAMTYIKGGINPSGIDPVQYRVLLLAEPVAETTAGGIITKAPKTLEQETWAQTKGYVVAVSDMAFTNDDKQWPCVIPKPGDKVMYAKYAGQLIEAEGLSYRMVKDDDILGVMR